LKNILLIHGMILFFENFTFFHFNFYFNRYWSYLHLYIYSF